MAPCNGTPKVGRHLPSTSTLEWHPAMAPSNGTLQWHPAMATRPRHQAMAPCPLPQSWSLPSPRPTIAHYNGTTSTPPKLVVTLPLNHSTLQWHPTMAPSNGTTSTAPRNGTLVPRPIRHSGSSPSPVLEVRTPIAIAIWGKNMLQFKSFGEAIQDAAAYIRDWINILYPDSHKSLSRYQIGWSMWCWWHVDWCLPGRKKKKTYINIQPGPLFKTSTPSIRNTSRSPEWASSSAGSQRRMSWMA